MDLTNGSGLSLLTACATGVGAGMVLGGFVVGIGSLLRSRSTEGFEGKIRDGGFLGGAVGLALLLASYLR